MNRRGTVQIFCARRDIDAVKCAFRVAWSSAWTPSPVPGTGYWAQAAGPEIPILLPAPRGRPAGPSTRRGECVQGAGAGTVGVTGSAAEATWAPHTSRIPKKEKERAPVCVCVKCFSSTKARHAKKGGREVRGAGGDLRERFKREQKGAKRWSLRHV